MMWATVILESICCVCLLHFVCELARVCWFDQVRAIVALVGVGLVHTPFSWFSVVFLWGQGSS